MLFRIVNKIIIVDVPAFIGVRAFGSRQINEMPIYARFYYPNLTKNILFDLVVPNLYPHV